MADRVCFIRAINVGGTGKLPMADLRELAIELGATDVSTYIASGNLLCSPSADHDEFDRALEAAIETKFGFFREVIGRTPDELVTSLAAHRLPIDDPKHSYVCFLTGTPASERVEALRELTFGDDQWQLIGNELHLKYVNGVAGSKLTNTILAKTLSVQNTSRNLNTLSKLIELAS